MRKEFVKGYHCVSLWGRTCQLDCTDCGMLRKYKNIGLNGEYIGKSAEGKRNK